MDTSSSRIWFITGCSSGFGAALVTAALRAGDRVFAAVRHPDSLAGLPQDPGCHSVVLDVCDTAAIPSVVAEAHKIFGRIDVLVNNAGAGLLGAVEETSAAEAAACMAVNFYGPLHLMQAMAPLFRHQAGGQVVNISAAAAIANYPGFALYGAAKAALESASESYRAELAPYGVKVTLVEPGPFRTDFIGRSLRRTACQLPGYEASSGKFAAMLEKMHGRQPGDPAKAAEVIVGMVHSGKAPLRLPLGRYAIKKVRDAAALRLRELEEWESVAAATEFTA